MSIPSGASLIVSNSDVNAGLQPNNSNNAIAPSPIADDDEPPSSGQFPRLTSLIHAKNSTSDQSAPPKDVSDEKGQPPIASNLIIDLEAQDASNERQIRFKVPFTFPRLSKRSRLRALFTPTRIIGEPPSYLRSVINTVKFSPLNVLLVFLPISWVMHWTHQSDALVFTTSALAILPLAALLGFGTEQIAIRTSSALAGLLNATLGNLTELVIAGIALTRCELALVQSTLLGGLLSNLLLVLGMAFIVGGVKYPQQSFKPVAAQLNSSLLTVGVISMILPTAFHIFLGDHFPDSTVEGPMLLQVSRGFSIILMVIYCSYLGFQFYTHSHLFVDSDSDSDTSSRRASWGDSSSSSGSSSSSSISGFRSFRSRRSSGVRTMLTAVSEKNSSDPATDTSPTTRVVDETGSQVAEMPIHPLTPISTIHSDDSASSVATIHYPRLNSPVAFVLLVAVTAFLYLTAENLLDSLQGLTESNPNGISKEFLSMIVLPILSNGAEHSTAVYVAFKGKFDLVLGVAVGSCTQISLFVIPLLVCLAWGMGKPLSLLFDPLETSCLFLSVLLVKFVIEDGRTHWLNGLTLVCVYVMIATTFWYFPTNLMGILGGNQSLFACTK